MARWIRTESPVKNWRFSKGVFLSFGDIRLPSKGAAPFLGGTASGSVLIHLIFCCRVIKQQYWVENKSSLLTLTPFEVSSGHFFWAELTPCCICVAIGDRTFRNQDQPDEVDGYTCSQICLKRTNVAVCLGKAGENRINCLVLTTYCLFLPATPYPHGFKCFTCEKAADNYECNRWAPDVYCPRGNQLHASV